MDLLLACMFIFGAAVETVQSSTCNETAVCWMRYDIAKELHSLRGVESCEAAYNFHCICSMTIDILYIDHPPYIYTDPNTKKVHGLLTGNMVSHYLNYMIIIIITYTLYSCGQAALYFGLH